MEDEITVIKCKHCSCTSCISGYISNNEMKKGRYLIKYTEQHVHIFNGKIHNENGPAIIVLDQNLAEDYPIYYLNGEHFSKEKWEEQLKTKLYW